MNICYTFILFSLKVLFLTLFTSKFFTVGKFGQLPRLNSWAETHEIKTKTANILLFHILFLFVLKKLIFDHLREPTSWWCIYSSAARGCVRAHWRAVNLYFIDKGDWYQIPYYPYILIKFFNCVHPKLNLSPFVFMCYFSS